MDHNTETLSEKEKETLRLILRGHDAKSMARQLDLSVHTVNDRLRAARRKLSVTSSKEAARVLLESENGGPENHVDKEFGDAESGQMPFDQVRPETGQKRRNIFVAVIGGLVIMSAFLAIFLLVSPMAGGEATASQETRSAAVVATDEVVAEAAVKWLALVDAENWQASFDAAGKQFRDPNTVETWKSASDLARGPLGPVLKREAISVQNVNAPPSGYTIVQFRTDFTNRAGVVENVTLENEGDAWRVVGYFLT